MKAFVILGGFAGLLGVCAALPLTGRAAPVRAGIAPAVAASPAGSTAANLDHLIRAEWNKAGIVPAPPTDDARYLRRVYLDVIGTLPPADVVRAFLADTRSDKRARLVQGLLDSPRYADYWTTYWNNLLMGRQVRSQVVDPSAFKDWLHTQFAQNKPYNQWVAELISATGQNSVGATYAQAYGLMKNPAAAVAVTNATNAPGGTNRQTTTGQLMTDGLASRPQTSGQTPPGGGTMSAASDGTMMSADGNAAPAVPNGPINGAVNWTLKYQGNPQDLSGTASKIFLGVQIQCAQCHDHKTEKWKQDDFRRFTACFVATRPHPLDTEKKIKGIRRVELVELSRPFVPRRQAKNPAKKNNNAEYAASQPTALDGTDFSNVPSRRAALAAWMTANSNPWFAEAIVNRMWNHFLGRGFIEPVDDIRPSNPAAAPEALQALTDDFVAHGYDLKHLVATICATQAYGLSSAPAAKNVPDNKLWAHYRLVPMGPETLMDSLVTATNMAPVLQTVAGGKLDALKVLMARQFTFLFDVDEEFEQKDFEGTIPQALMLLNGNLVNRGATPIPGTTLADVLALPDDRARIEELYLRTLSRRPTSAETTRWLDFIHAPRPVVDNSGNPQNGVQAAQGSNSGPNARAASLRQRMQMRQMLAGAGKKKRNNGYDPLARLAVQAAPMQQSPETQAYEDMFWALLNSSEFIFNH